MSFQISNILKGDAGINLNHISINCSKKMASITEWALRKEHNHPLL